MVVARKAAHYQVIAILAAQVEVSGSVSIGTGMGSEWLRQTGAKSWNQGCQTGNVFQEI